MARAVTLAKIFERARFHADMRNSGFAKDATLITLMNDIYPKLYRKLVEVDENYYIADTTFAITSGTEAYDLPADFFKLSSVEYSADGGGTFYTLFPFNGAERNEGFSASALPNGLIRLCYVPTPVTFTLTSETVDGIAGFDRLISLALAIDLLDAEESNTDRIYRKYKEELNDIESGAERDIGMPGTVSDTSIARGRYMNIKYRMYGDTIEFINSQEHMGIFFG